MSTSTPPTIHLYDSADLAARVDMGKLNQMINDAFDAQDRSSLGEPDMFPVKRVTAHDQISRELGAHGRLAVAFDAAGNPVAATAVNLWPGRKADVIARSQAPLASDAARAQTPDGAGARAQSDAVRAYPTENWELAMAVTSPSGAQRGKGLCGKCQECVVAHLLRLRAAAAEAGAEHARRPLALWITALEGVGNMEYWGRRGFVRQGAADEMPVGTWGSTRSFHVGTGLKMIE